jgi:coenzyme PQQ synthesis protein D (PqqD)
LTPIGPVVTRGVTDQRVFSRTPQIEEAPLAGELMLFDPQTSRFFVLNRTMAFVWRRCGGNHTVARMLADITQEFEGVDPEVAVTDLEKSIEELVTMGLVVAVPVSGSEHRA